MVKKLSEYILLSWLILNLLSLPLAVTAQEDIASQDSYSSNSYTTGHFGRVTPTATNEVSQPETAFSAQQNGPFAKAQKEPRVIEVELKSPPYATMLLVLILLSLSLFIRRKSLVLVSAGMGLLLAGIAVAQEETGVCLKPGIPEKICQAGMTRTECCNDLTPGTDLFHQCNDTFQPDLQKEQIADCVFQSNACCVDDEILTCDNTVVYRAQCNGTFYTQDCADVPDCMQGCCIYQDDDPVNPSPSQCQMKSNIACVAWGSVDPYLSNNGFILSLFNQTSSGLGNCPAGGCGDFSSQPSNITGYVRDESSVGIIGANVSAGVIEAVTDGNGYYELIGVHSGFVWITVEHMNYDTEQESVQIADEGGVEVSQNFALGERLSGRIEGRVFRGSDPSEDALVELSLENFYASYVTGSDGYFEFDDLVLDETYSVSASKVDLICLTGCGNYLLNSTTPSRFVSLSLGQPQGHSVSGRLVDEDGAVVSSSQLLVFKTSASGTPAATPVSQSDGTYDLELNAGDYYIMANMTDVRAKHSGYNDYETTEVHFEVVDDDLEGLEVVIFNNTANKKNNLNCSSTPYVFDPYKGNCCSYYECKSGSGSVAYAADCNAQGGGLICCSAQCTLSIDDTDGDGVADSSEQCPYEPRLISPTADSEVGMCSDGIDNDCDSTHFYSSGPPFSDNVDDDDDDCQFCPPDRCTYATNTYCNETSNSYIQFTLPNETYCSVCSQDPDCQNECELEGGVCCDTCQQSDILSEFAGDPSNGGCDIDGSGQVCCSSCLQIPGGQYECVEYDWLCPSNEWLNNGTYTCPKSGTTYQNPCMNFYEVPQCILGEQIRNALNQEDPQGLERTIEACDCGAERYDLPYYGNEYCCYNSSNSSYYTAFACEEDLYTRSRVPVQVEGFNKSQSEGLLYFHGTPTIVSVVVDDPPSYTCDISDTNSQQCNLNHSYRSLIIGDEFTFIVSAPGYVTSVWPNVPIPATGPIELNISMGTDCASLPAVDTFRALAVPGSPAVNLTWSGPECENVSQFRIDVRKEGTLIKTEYLPNSSTNWTHDEHPDGNDWNTDYNYTIRVEYDNSPYYNDWSLFSKSVNLTTGDPECAGQTPNWEFCLNSSYGTTGHLYLRGFCDGANRLNSYDRWPNDEPANPDEYNCIVDMWDNPDAICRGPFYDGEEMVTACSLLTDCQAAGPDQNPFGMYFEREMCHTNATSGESNFCYFDASYTIADNCYDCDQEGTCYDYRTEDACLVDNCNNSANGAVPPNQGGCGWIDTFPEIGKGICYTPNYTGTDQCRRCSEFSPFFNNPNCTEEICSLLGDCFLTGGSCLGCDESANCASYEDPDSCNGGQNITITNHQYYPFLVEESLDTCGVGRCRWDYGEEKCVKDGNDDGLDDCEGSSNPSACRDDNTPPDTFLRESPPQFINQEGQELFFRVSDDNALGVGWFMYCLSDSQCEGVGCDCSDNLTRKNIPSDNEVDVNISDDYYENLSHYQGLQIVNFFSVDRANNTEQLDTFGIMIDTISPNLTITHQEGPHPRDSRLSNVNVTVLSDEPLKEGAVCPDNALIRLSNFEETTADTCHRPNETAIVFYYSAISDGQYNFTTTLHDRSDNPASKFIAFPLNRNSLVIDKWPDSDIYTYPPPDDENRLDNIFTTLHHVYVNTTTDVSCNLTEENSTENVPKSVEQYTDDIYGIINRTDFNIQLYDAYDGDEANYKFNLNCTNNAHHDDDEIVFFAIDYSPPSSSLTVRGQAFNPNIYYNDSALERFELSCEDQDINNTRYPEDWSMPGKADCDGNTIEYGIVGLAEPCAGSLSHTYGDSESIREIQSMDESFRLCYRSMDYKDNAEGINIADVMVDTSAPEVDFDPSIPDLVTSSYTLEVEGNWSDEGSGEAVSARIYVFNGTVWNNYTAILSDQGGGRGTVSSYDAVPLKDGRNPIRIVVWDSAGNDGSATADVYVDVVAPEITSPASVTSVNANGPGQVHYGDDAEFEIEIEDNEYTQIGGVEQNLVSLTVVNDTDAVIFSDQMETSDNHTFNYTWYNSESPPGNYSIQAGNYSAVFSYRDSLGNSNTTRTYFEVKDSQPPILNYSITETSPSYPGILYETNRTYDVEINLSEPLAVPFRIDYAFPPSNPNYIVSDGLYYDLNTNKTELNLTYHVSENRLTGTLYIPPDTGAYSDLDNATIKLVGDISDLNGNSRDFMDPLQNPDKHHAIHTLSDDTPVIILPEFDKGTEFTDQEIMELYGYNDDDRRKGPVTVTLNVTNDSADYYYLVENWISTTDATTEPGIEQKISASVSGDYLEGDTSVIVDVDDTLIAVGDGIDFSGHDRLTEELYTVTVAPVHLGGENYNLTFTPGLEANLTDGTIDVYDGTRHAGWFKENITIGAEYGTYFVWGFSYNEYDQLSSNPMRLRIVYDPIAPYDEGRSPMGSGVKNYSDINLTINDVHSEVSPSSVLMVFNYTDVEGNVVNTSANCAGALECTWIDADDPSQGMGIRYDNGQNFSIGWYDVWVYYEDIAGNSNETEWQFAILNDLPFDPEVSISEGREGYTVAEQRSTEDEPDTYIFTNNSAPYILINFTKEQGQQISLDEAWLDITDNVTDSLSGLPGNAWAFDRNLVLDEGRHQLDLKARKFVDGSWGYYSTPMYILIADMTYPVIDVQDTYYGRYGQNPYTIDGNCTEENFAWGEIRGDIQYDGTVALSAEDCDGSGFSKSVLLETNLNGDGVTNDLQIVVCDKSDNCQSEDTNVVSDNTPPAVSMAGVSQENDSSADAYSTNSTVYAVGLSPDDGEECEIAWGDSSTTDVGTASSAAHTYPSDGEYTAVYSCTDEAGNEGSDEDTIIVDTTQPQIDDVALQYEYPDFDVSGYSVNITFRLNDTGSGIDASTLEVYVNGTPLDAASARLDSDADPYIFRYVDTQALDGIKTPLRYEIIVRDNAGMNASSQGDMYIDNIVPAIRDVVAPELSGTPYLTGRDTAEMIVYVSEEALCRYHTSDVNYSQMPFSNEFPLSAVEPGFLETSDRWYSNSTIDLLPGLHTYYFSCMDVAENDMAGNFEVLIDYDNTPPVFTAEMNLRGKTYQTFTDDMFVEFNGTSEQLVEVTSWRTDSEEVLVNSTIIEEVRDVDLGLTHSGFYDEDTGSYISSLTLARDSTLTFHSNTAWDYIVERNWDSQTEYIEVTPEGANRTIIFDDLQDNTFNFTSPGGDHVLQVTITDLTGEYRMLHELKPDETNYIYLIANDTLGQENRDYAPPFYWTVYYDPDAPNISLITPLEGSIIPDMRKSFTIRAAESIIESGINTSTIMLHVESADKSFDCSYEVCENGSAEISTSFEDGVLDYTFTPQENLSGQERSQINVTFRAADNIGNNDTLEFYFTVDTAAPQEPTWSYTGEMIHDGQKYTGEASPVATIVFSEPVEIVDFTVDGQQETLANDANITFTYEFSEHASDAAHDLEVQAKKLGLDTVGTYPDTIRVDVQDPSVTISSASNDNMIEENSTYYRTNDQEFILNTTYSDSNPDTLSATGDIVSYEEEVSSSGTRQLALNLTSGDGNKTVTVTLTDIMGRSSSDSVLIELDTTGPGYVELPDLSTITTNRDSVNITGYTTDEAEYVWLRVRNYTDPDWYWSKLFNATSGLETGSVLLDENVLDSDAAPGDTTIIADDGLCDDYTSSYLQFGEERGRYEIEGCVRSFNEDLQWYLRLTLSDMLADAYPAGSEISSHSREVPNGAFSAAVPLDYDPADHYIYAFAYDDLDNPTSTSTSIFRNSSYDDMQVTITEPIEGSYHNSDTLTISAQVSSPAEICYYDDGSGAQAMAGSGTSWSINVEISEGNDQTYDVICEPVDLISSGESDITFNVDRTSPDISLDPLGITNSDTVTVTGSCSDANPGNVTVYSPGAGEARAPCSGSFSVEIDVPDQDGVHVINALSTDLAGNTAEASTTVELDLTAPGQPYLKDLQEGETIYVTDTSYQMYGYTDEPFVNVTAVDESNILEGYEYTTINTSCEDNVEGNQLDNFNGTAGDDFIGKEVAAGYIETGDHLFIPGQDTYGFLYYTVMDVEAAPAPWSLDTITLDMLLTEDVQRSDQLYICSDSKPTGWFNISLELDSNQRSEYRLTLYDDVGNSETYGPYYIVHDESSPEVSSRFPTPGSITADEADTVSFTVTDATSGIVRESIVMNITYNGTTHSYASSELTITEVTGGYDVSRSFSPALGEDSYSVLVYAEDLSSNDVTDTWSFEVSQNATHRPTLVFEKDVAVKRGEVYYIGSLNPHIIINYSEDAPDQVWMYELGYGSLPNPDQDEDITNYSRVNNYSFDLDFDDAWDGRQTYLNVEAYKYFNSTHNTSVALSSFELRFDVTDPVVTIDPINYTNQYESVPVSGTCEDDFMDIIWIEGEDIVPVNTTCSPSATYSASVDLIINPDAEQEITLDVTGYDYFGHSDTESHTFTYDSEAPGAVTLESPTHNDSSVWYSDSDVVFNWSGPSDYSGISGYQYVYDDAPTSEPSGSIEGYQSETYNNVPDGQHYFHIRAVDNAGNPGIITDKGFRVDTTGPKISNIRKYPEPASDSTTVSFDADDAGLSGVHNASVSLHHMNGTQIEVSITTASVPGYDYSFTLSGFPDDLSGVYLLNITSSDNARPQNVGYATADLEIDNLASQITSIEAPSRTASPSEDIIVTTDENSTCRYDTQDVGFAEMDHTMLPGSSTVHESTVSFSEDGTYTYYFRCRDIYGNTMESSESHSITYDSTPPVLAAVDISPLVYTEGNIDYTGTMPLTASGTSEQMANITVLADGPVASMILDETTDELVTTNTTHGFTRTYIETAIGSTLTIENTQYVPADITSDYPGYESFSLDEGESQTLPLDDMDTYVFNLSYNDADMNSLTVVVGPLTNRFDLPFYLSPGLQFVDVTSADDLGNTNALSSLYNIYYDNMFPSYTNMQPNTINNNTQPLSVTISETGSGLNESTIQMNLTSDDDNPNNEFVCDLDGCNLGATLTYDSSDGLLTIDPHDNVVWTDANYSILTLSVYSEDNVENANLTAYDIEYDIRAPTLLGWTYVPQGYTESRYVDTAPEITAGFEEPVYVVSAMLGSQDVTSDVNYNLAGDELILYTDELSLSDGSYTYVLTATRRSVEAEGTYTSSFVLDTQDPTVTISDDVPSYTGRSPVEITGTCSDANLDSVSVNGAGVECTDGVYSRNVDLGPGENLIEVIATDLAGRSGVASKTIEYDNTPPFLYVYPTYSPSALPDVEIEGIADLNSTNVTIFVFDDEGSTAGQYEINRSELQSSQEPLSSSILFNDATSQHYVDVEGHVCSDFDDPDTYIQFEDDYFRYRLTGECEERTYFTSPYSRVHITETIYGFNSIDAGREVYVYDGPLPEGYFSQEITLSEGMNTIWVRNYNEYDAYSQVERTIVYDPTITLGINIISPEVDTYYCPSGLDNRCVTREDYFDIGNGSYTIEITTNPEFDADCTISHSRDAVATDFESRMVTFDGSTHTFMISDDKCYSTAPSQPYCLILGDGSEVRPYDPVDHYYTVKCSAPNIEAETIALNFTATNRDVLNNEPTDFICANRDYCTYGTVNGRVTDLAGVPLVGAVVQSLESGSIAYTSADGEYSLSRVPVGTSDITFTDPAHVTETVTVSNMEPGETRSGVDAQLEKLAHVFGTVTDDNGDEVDNLTVRFSGSSTYETQTTQGDYEIYLPADSYSVSTEKYGYEPAYDTITVSSGEERQLDLSVVKKKTGDIVGTVTDEDGEIIEGVSVVLSEDGVTTGTSTTNAVGQYYFGPVFVGHYDLSFSKYAYLPEERPVQVTDGMTSVVSVTMYEKPTGILSGTVTDSSGAPVEGAAVTLQGTPLSPAITDAEGMYSFGAVATGTYTMQVERSGFFTRTLGIGVSEGSNVYDVTLDRMSTMLGDVVLIDEEGVPEPTPYYNVYVSTDPPAVNIRMSDALDSFTIEGGAGSYVVTVSKEGYNSRSKTVEVIEGETKYIGEFTLTKSGDFLEDSYWS